MTDWPLRALPHDMREDLFNLHATGVNPRAHRSTFFARRVPLRTLRLEGILVSPIPVAQIQPYVDHGPENMPPVVICDGRLIDGMHRITAARIKGFETLQCIDVSGLVSTVQSGFISTLPANSLV